MPSDRAPRTEKGAGRGCTFLASTAEGFLGEEKLKLGGVDLRAPAGIGLQVVGLYKAIKGKKGASHYLSVGNGVTGSWVSSLGRAAGEALREKREKGKPPAPAAQGAQPQAQQQPQPEGQAAAQPGLQGGANLAPRLEVQPRVSLLAEPAVQGPVREVYLTPAASPRARQPAPARSPQQEGPRRQPHPQGPRRGGRFVRAVPSDDDAT